MSNTLCTIKYYSVVEWACLPNQNQLNSPKTEENPPHPRWLVLGASSNKHSQLFQNTLMAFFFSNHFDQVLNSITGPFSSKGRTSKVWPAATTQYFLRELKKKSKQSWTCKMTVQHWLLQPNPSGMELQTSPSASVYSLCLTWKGEKTARWTHRQCDKQTSNVRLALILIH